MELLFDKKEYEKPNPQNKLKTSEELKQYNWSSKEESEIARELVKIIGINLETATVDQLESIKMILQMTPSDVEKTKAIIELLSRIIREAKSKE